MFSLNIEMYGIPQDIYSEYKIEVELPDKAALNDVVPALKKRLPALEGPVIEKGQERLTEEYNFIVNGQSQPAESNIQIKPDDRVVLVLMATGG